MWVDLEFLEGVGLEAMKADRKYVVGRIHILALLAIDSVRAGICYLAHTGNDDFR